MENKVKGINLLPNEYIVAQKINLYEKIISAVMAVEVACFIGFVVIPPKQEVERTRLLLEQKQQEANSPRYAGVNKTLSDLEETKKEIDNWVTSCNQLDQGNAVDKNILDQVTARVPVGVTLTSIELSKGVEAETNVVTQNIIINGFASSVADEMNYYSVLETVFPSADIQKTGSAEGFVLTIKISQSAPADGGGN